MNAYDFDKTIYGGDSTVDFYLFSLRRHPSILRFAPKQAWAFLLYALGRIRKTEMKERFFSFFQSLDTEGEVKLFWQKHECKIYSFYLKQKREDDVVISASPEFLLRPICRKLGVGRLLASRVDPKNGVYTGENCYGEEKVRRLFEDCGIRSVDEFYSDSVSDLPMAKIAKRAFLIQKGTVVDWKIH